MLGDAPNRIGRFILTYHSFLSTFVIGVAGLVATSIWQYRQAETQERNATSQQRIAAEQAANDWRIERAEILSKNLSVLSSAGPETVEQRYGVLLSLTRGNIIDPELTVSYALELGKDNPLYMKSVLSSTPEKSYARLATAFEVPCEQRFGTTRDVAICPSAGHVQRSLALADLFAEDIDATRPAGREGPTDMLRDERIVQSMLLKLAALFSHHLIDLYERRQWAEVERFEAISPGARLVSALVLGPSQPNSFVAASEVEEVERFHKKRTDWVQQYLLDNACNGDCKGRIVEMILTSFAEANGNYDAALREMFDRPRGEVGMALARLHSRLLQCQVAGDDAMALRDKVLVPALVDSVKRRSREHQTLLEDILSLLSLTPDPPYAKPEDQPLRTAWSDALALARNAEPALYDAAFTERRTSVQITRKNPPDKLKRSIFCTAEEVSLADVAIEE